LFRPTHFASGLDAPFGFTAGGPEATTVDAATLEELDDEPAPGDAVDAVGSTDGPPPAGLLEARDADADALGGGAFAGTFFFATNFDSFGKGIGVERDVTARREPPQPTPREPGFPESQRGL
jgi:hypothetical protein